MILTQNQSCVELDVPSDNQIDLPEGTLSDSSSTNDGTGLLQELESLSDFVEGEQYENGENSDDPSGPERDNDLCIDLDNLANDTRSPDDMYDILNNDPEWTQNFSDIHVNQFTGHVETNSEVILTHHWHLHLTIFNSIFLTMSSSKYVTIQTSLKNFKFNKRTLHHQILLKNSGRHWCTRNESLFRNSGHVWTSESTQIQELLV